mmetsp:Transcript_11976/g.28191  ORF Transcript_11976/g.28191 Transcript_11976/m.28191 type:complete len:203 (+) Transcript_11976:107-715(+)
MERLLAQGDPQTAVECYLEAKRELSRHNIGRALELFNRAQELDGSYHAEAVRRYIADCHALMGGAVRTYSMDERTTAPSKAHTPAPPARSAAVAARNPDSDLTVISCKWCDFRWRPGYDIVIANSCPASEHPDKIHIDAGQFNIEKRQSYVLRCSMCGGNFRPRDQTDGNCPGSTGHLRRHSHWIKVSSEDYYRNMPHMLRK